MVLVWALWSYLCRWWKIYGHIWQSRCTNCFLALSNERFFYLCVEEGRFLDTDLFQLDNFFHSINMLDLHYGFWLFCCYAIGYLSSSTSSVIFFNSFCFSMLIFYVFYVRRWQQALSTWNAFCFSVKLFIMMFLWYSSFFRFRLSNTTQKMKFSYSSHQFVLLEVISTIF